MYSLLIKILIKYCSVITIIGESIAYSVMFSLGICRYRLAIYIAISGVVRAIAITKGISKNTLDFLITLCSLPFVYLDILKGQIYPVYPNMNVFLSVGATLLSAYAFGIYFDNLVQKMTNNTIFTYCLNCKFEDSRLVRKCSNCGSTVDSFNECNNNHDKPESLLDIADGEYIVEQYHFGSFRGVYKNSNKLQVKKVIITNIRTIFIDYNFYRKGWTSREVVNNNEIAKIFIEKKKHRRVTAPILTIHTTDGIDYELFYHAADSAVFPLKKIANCLVSQNSEIELIVKNEI